jgi:hypothetical protein
MFTADIALAGGGGYTLGLSIAAPDANHLQVFVPWTDTAIYEYTRTNGSWSSYLGPFSSGFTSAPASCGYASNMSVVFARKADNALWYAHAKTDGTIVGSWTSLGSPPGYVFQGSPAAVNTNGYSYVFGRGTDNQLWYRRSNDSGRTNWGPGWTAVGGQNKLYSDPSAASYASGWVHVFGLTSSSSLQYVAYNGSSWPAWTSPADTAGPYHYPPVVTSSGPNQLDLFVRGYSDNVIHYRKYYGSMGLAPNWTSLDYVTSSNPAVASRATGVMDLVFLGPNADVHFAEGGD